MIAKVAEFLSGCPYLYGETVNINYLDKADGAISLGMSQKSVSLKEYSDGGALKGVFFILSLCKEFGPSFAENTRISENCESIENWVEEQNLKGNLPKLDGGREVVSIGVSKRFGLVHTNRIAARYEAEIEVIYYNN